MKIKETSRKKKFKENKENKYIKEECQK